MAKIMIPKRKRREKMGVRESSRIECPGHLKWIRGCVCTIHGKSGHVCEGRVQAAHLRLGNHAGMGQKPGDDQTYPLCALAHKIQHDIGEITFQLRYGFNAQEAAAWHWKNSPARIKWEQRKERSNG